MRTNDQLRLYLRDHRAGAAAGERLARRCRDHASVEHRARLSAIADEVEADRATLDEIMAALGVHRSRVKEAVACAGEMVSRLKLNRRLVTRAPASSVLEIEMLISGVSAKRQLWSALASLPDLRPALAQRSPSDLVVRADSQLDRLREVHEAMSGPSLTGDILTTAR